MIARAIVAAIVVAASSTTVRAQWQSLPPPPPQLVAARELLVAGNYPAAETAYAELLRAHTALGSHAAAANFGYALAMQQGVSGADSVAPARVAMILEAYNQAALINPELRASASSNVGLLFRSLGDHAASARSFASAAQAARDSSRIPLWLEAGGEYELADSARRAAEMYSKVLELDRDNRRAIEGLIRNGSMYAGVGDVLGWAERWVGDTGVAIAVADGMLTLLTREGERPRASDERRALGYVAIAATNARLGPGEFAARMRARLGRVADSDRAVGRGAAALSDAYASRAPHSEYVEPTSAQWWHDVTRERRAWSGMLRWLGDWHNQRGSSRLARSFYEAAVGKGGENLTREWADAKALVPLALLYARSGDDTSGTLTRNVQDYTERLFVGKTAAYQRNDLEAIRTFHTALGSYYASKGQWSGTGARNAEFQLSRMSEVTRQLNQQGKRVSDSPELLAKLAGHYDSTGKKARADSLRQAVRLHYEIRKRPEKADSLFNRTQRPVPARPSPATLSALEAARNVNPERVQQPAPAPATPVERARPIQGRAATGMATQLAIARVTVTGTVAAARTPLANVVVKLIVGSDTTNATTNASGGFRASVPGAATVRVSIVQAGYAVYSADLPADKPLLVNLVRGR